MPDSNTINNPFLDDQDSTKISAQSGSKFDPSTAKPVANTTPTSNNKNSKFDPSTAKAVDKGFGGHVRDLGASLMGGLASVPDVAVGVADLYSGGRAGKAVDNLSDNFKLGEGRKYWQDQKTDQAKVQSQEFSDAEGIIDKTKVALSNPSMISNTVVESLPSMALGGLAGRGLNVASKGLINPVAAGAAGEGLVMAGAQAEQIRQETDDGLLSGKQVAAAAGTGVAGSLLGFLGGSVARKLGFEDVDTLMARGIKPEQVAGEISQIPFSSIPKSVMLGAISEGLLEEMPQSVTEQILQNYALDKDLFEGVDDAIVMGTLAGMAMGGTVAGGSQASKWAGQSNTVNPEAGENTDTTGSTPMLPAPTGGNGGTGLGFDGLQGEYIPADQQSASQQAKARQNFEYDQMSTDADNLINYDGQSSQPTQKPSQQMGLDPNLGPLSAAAATAVDSGISQQMQIEMQAQAAAEASANTTGKTTDKNAPLQQAATAVRELTPEQIHGKQNTYGTDVTTAIEQLKQRQKGEQNVKSDVSQVITPSQSPNEIQTSEAKPNLIDAQSKVTELEAQFSAEKSIPKKAQIRKQITELQDELSTQAQSDVNIGSPQKSTVENHRENFAKMDGAIAKVNAVRQRMREANPEIFTEANDLVRETHSLTNARVTAIADEIESSGSYELSDREYDKIKSNPNYKIDYNPKTFIGKVTAVKDQHSGEWVGNSEQPNGQSTTQVNAGKVTQNEIQTSNNQTKVSELEVQLATEKSLPKKAQLRKQIARLQEDNPIDQAAHEAASSNLNDRPEPTPAQIEAGNYKKGHIKVHGLDIAVENPRGSERRGTDPDGKEWAHTMSDHYGYIKKTTGADNEHIDTYVGRNPESDQVFIVDQIDQKTDGFDEHKVMMGFNSQEDAIQAYSSNFDKGWKVGPVRAMSKDEFKTWLKDGDTKKPAGESAVLQSETNVDPQNVQREYGDNLESVMSDVETLADDFTIDLHSVPKKKNALKNPNYHAVQHENGRVEILGMKHPSTGEWIGKAPTQEKASVQDNPAPVQEQSKDIKSNPSEKPNSSKPITEKSKISEPQTKKTEASQKLYSRVDDQSDQGSTIEQVREALVDRFGEKTIASLEQRGLLDIVSTVDEPGVEGFYQNGRVTLVANNLNETSIIPTFLHELGGHGAFQNMMSEQKYAELMDIFNDMVKRKHPLALEAKRLAERETDVETQQLEYLPYLLTLASTQQEMNALQKSAIKRFIDKIVSAVKAWVFDRSGVNLNLNENDMVALANRMVSQIGNQTQQNIESPLYSRQANAQQIIQNLVGNMNKQGRDKLKTEAGYKAKHALQYVLGALGRRQLAELYQKLLPELKPYSDMVAMMDADQNEVAALSDDLARRWADLKDEKELADVMHDATLAKIDPAKPYQPGDNVAEYTKLKKQFDTLSGDAKKVYREARDAYKKHHRDVRQAIQERILRSSMSNKKKTELLQQMDSNFFGYTQGVYFPLQRFGKYVVLVRDAKDQVISVSRAETLSEAHKMREILQSDYPNAKVNNPVLDKKYDAARDGVGRGFMTNLFNELGSFGLNTQRQAELEDILGQLYLKSLPDLSYAKHSVHRKGTAGFSQDARRTFAQNMFHGGSYLAKLRYKDQLEEMLDGMQKHATEQAKIDNDYDQPVAQQVIDEMNQRHKNMMEANSHPLSTALTSLGFLYYLGLSPASAAVNTLQTVLVAYPQMGAKWGYDKAGTALAQASNDFRKGVSINGINPKNWENDIGKILKGDELKAYEEAVRRGVIDVTMAHDLAGIAQGEDSGVMWKLRPIMRVASTLFHNAERFNREVTFIAAYRLARDSGSMHDQAFEQAMDSTYKGHFDYSSGNRPRIMQGNIAKVIFLFKQFGQNMIYTLARTAHQSLKGETPEARREAQRALVGIIGMHTVFAGVMGLPLVGPLLAVASMLGSDDDEPWDAEAALRNVLADTLGTKTSEVLMKGASRFGPADLSGRVGINNLLLPDVQDGLEGKDFSDAMVMSALGSVVGILTNSFKGLAEMGQGHGMRGVETMSPVFLRSPLRSIRYATEGAQDKTGIMIKDDVGMLSLTAQAVGFSPSEVRLATEGRSAIYSHTKRLDKRRTELMTDYVRAIQRDDADGQKELWAEIQAFNQKNPLRRISRVQAMQSLRQREKRVKQAEHGIYLPNKKREDADIGRFAFDD